MTNKILSSIKKYNMISGGETVICAVSGGADSMYLLWNMHLLEKKLNIKVEAAHFNHNLRGEESDSDERFVTRFCRDNNIPLHIGSSKVKSGNKGLEAAARDARYEFFNSLNGIIATAHTADDNTETIIMHLIRGTGLHGLGGIAPIRGNIIRPMLDVTREEIEEFLFDNDIPHIEDSSNYSDDFFRNRVRHNIIPLLRYENPRIVETVSSTAQNLRKDDDILDRYTDQYIDQCMRGNANKIRITDLKRMNDPIRIRTIRKILAYNGFVEDITSKHINQIDSIIMGNNPSASVCITNGYVVRRNYDEINIDVNDSDTKIRDTVIRPGHTIGIEISKGLIITIKLEKIDSIDKCEYGTIAACVSGDVHVRSRMPGDRIKLVNGCSKSLKKIFIDRKFPACTRSKLPVIYDDDGIIAVYNVGMNHARKQEGDNLMKITFGIRGA